VYGPSFVDNELTEDGISPSHFTNVSDSSTLNLKVCDEVSNTCKKSTLPVSEVDRII
jgi:hypothetical protein